MLSALLSPAPPRAGGAGLSVGDEVDYNVVDGFWVPARVERVEEGGGLLLLRFVCGCNDVLHRVYLSRAGDARRVAAACECFCVGGGGRAGPRPRRRAAP